MPRKQIGLLTLGSSNQRSSFGPGLNFAACGESSGGVRFKNGGQFARRLILMAIHHSLDDGRYIGETNAFFDESLDCFFIRGVHRGGQRPTFTQRAVCQGDTRKAIRIRRLEMKCRQRRQIERRLTRATPFGIRQRILDCVAHVRDPHLRND